MSDNKRPAEELDSRSSPPPAKRVQHETNHVKEPSIFNIKPADDITKYIADFISKYCHMEHVEIEAKLGVLVDKQTKQRIAIDALTETIIDPKYARHYRFESNMALEQHRHFNKILNDLVNKSQARDYKGERIKYRHTIETDRFYEVGRQKWRVTTDKDGKIVPNGVIEKQRVADLNIHAPNQPLDYRISINLEKPRSKPNTSPNFERSKDRISYQHGNIAFDLTQVKGTEDTRHELELEFADATILAQEFARYNRKEPSQYTQMIEALMNNIRLLSRSALKQ
ncbi:CYTH-like domain-containing protein [Blakeslea trispora]|nr:CYTH-like domain-containing protein [Blakeslea trispora]